jgi:hypothetical protein
VTGFPEDAFFKSGAGVFCIYAVPSLDLGFSGEKQDGDASRAVLSAHSFRAPSLRQFRCSRHLTIDIGRLYLNEEIDLSACELEPLRTLGSIQSDGCLIAFGWDRVVSYISANATDFLGIEPDRILNRELSQLCSPAKLAALESRLPNLAGGQVERFVCRCLSFSLVAPILWERETEFDETALNEMTPMRVLTIC